MVEPDDWPAAGWKRLLTRFSRSSEGTVTLRIDWTLFAILCLGAVFLQIVLYRHAGAFWRDEASSLLVASAPDLRTMWAWLAKDSAPVLMYCLIRLWRVVGLGATDAGLRALGTLVALGIIAALFVSCRSLTGRVPSVAMALVVFNASVFYYGSSLRAYGLAILLILPCAAAFWSVAVGPTAGNVAASTVFALLSCHASYQNSYLLLAIGLAAATACAANRLWMRCLLVLGIGLSAAVSLLVYLPTIRDYRDVAVTVKAADAGRIARRLVTMLAESGAGLEWAWAAVLACAAVCAILPRVRGHAISPVPSAPATPSVRLFGMVLLVVALTTGLGFRIAAHGVSPNPWHFVPLVALAGLTVEVVLQSERRPIGLWVARIAITCAVVALSLPALWSKAHLRRSNLDRVSEELAHRAGSADVILLNPFWLAPGFKYYYRGMAEWNTVPLTSSATETSLLPYARVKALMARRDPLRPTLERIDRTLVSGNRLWIVGTITLSAPGVVPIDLPPAPSSPAGWDPMTYLKAWQVHVGHRIQRHAGSVRIVPVDVGQAVDSIENVPLIRIEGWREQ